MNKELIKRACENTQRDLKIKKELIKNCIKSPDREHKWVNVSLTKVITECYYCGRSYRGYKQHISEIEEDLDYVRKLHE